MALINSEETQSVIVLAGTVREDCPAMSDNQRVSRITLSVDRLSLAEEHHLPTRADGCKKGSRVGNANLLGHWADDTLTRPS